jgi:hypothetical protein
LACVINNWSAFSIQRIQHKVRKTRCWIRHKGNPCIKKTYPYSKCFDATGWSIRNGSHVNDY